MKNIFDKIFPKEKITLGNGKVVFRPRSKTPLITIIVILLMYISINVTGFNFEVFENFGNFFNILKGMIPPDFSYSGEVLTPLFDTIKMSLMGSFLGALVSLPIAILASSNITKNKFVNGFFKLFLSILRTLPSLVCALIATYIWGLGTFAGTVAIFIFSLSYVGKLLYESIETVDMGAFECMESMGFTKFYAFRYAILPVVLPSYISTALFNFEGNVRYAAILGYVGAGGIGAPLIFAMNNYRWNEVGSILVGIIVLVLIIEVFSNKVRRKLARGY